MNLNLPLPHTLLLCSITVLSMSTMWFFIELGKHGLRLCSRGFASVPSEENPTTPPPTDILSFSQTIQITPLIFWYYVHAIGGSVFVLAYCLTGLSTLPTLCVLFCIAVYATSLCFTSSQARFLHIVWFLAQLFAILFLGLDALLRLPFEQPWATFLLGVFLPLCASTLILRLSRALYFIPISPHHVIAFILPSLMLLSALCLSLYFATDTSSASYYHSIFLTFDNATNVNASSLANATSFFYSHLDSFFFTNITTNVTRPHYSFSPNAPAFFLLILLCPSAMYSLLTLFLASFRSIPSIMHNASAYTFAYALRRLWHPSDFSYFSVLSLLCTACACLIATFVLPSNTPPNLEDEEQDDMVAYQRPSHASDNSTPHDENPT